MWHTAQISCPASQAMLDIFFSRKGEIYPENGIWKNSKIASEGIEVWTYKVKKSDFRGTLIYAKINFMKLLKAQNRVLVASERHNRACFAVFAELMQSYFPELPSDINEWTANRVDYCINASTEYFNEYSILANKSLSRLRTHEKCAKGQSYYYGNQSYTINIYNKASNVLEDLRARQDMPPVEKGRYLNDSWGILRIEVQCLPRKLTQIKGKRGLENKTLGELLKDAIAMEILEWMLLHTVGMATYWRRSVAIEKIKCLEFRADKKARLIQMVKDIANAKSMEAVQKRYEKEGIMAKQTFDRYCKDLEAANINPVTIPDSWKLSGGNVDSIPGLYDLYLSALQDEFGDNSVSDADV